MIRDPDSIMTGFPPPLPLRPGPETWDLPPENRWSFRNMRMLFPTIEVRRGKGAESPLTEDFVDLSGLSVPMPSGTMDFARWLAATHTDGLLVHWRGRTIHQSFHQGMAPHALHLSQSVAKTVVGTLCGILAHLGHVELDRPLAGYIPELAAAGHGDATLRHVLDMQSGVAFMEDYNHPQSDMTRIDRAAGWRPQVPGQPYESIADIIVSLKKTEPHGTRFSYRSVETDVVSWVLERVMGEHVAELVSHFIWEPMGAERDACFTVDRAGTAVADGGFNATLADYARFGRLTLEAGTSRDPGIVPLSWVEDCQKGEHDKFTGDYRIVHPNGAYRGTWWIRDVARGDLVARGVFGQMIYVDRASDLMVVKLSSWPDYTSPVLAILTYKMIDAIRDHLEQL